MKTNEKVKLCFAIISISVFVIFIMKLMPSYEMGSEWPMDYGYAKWVSESGDIWFEYTGNETLERNGKPVLEGGMTVDGTEYACKIVLWGPRFMSFCTDEDYEFRYDPTVSRSVDQTPDTLLVVDCKFFPEKIVAKVKRGKYSVGEKIIFTKYSY